MQDLQLVAVLLQTSKQVQQAVTHVLTGQLAVQLQAHTLQQVQCLAQWMHKNACLVRSLDLQLPSSTRLSAAVVTALGNTLQHAAAAAGSLQSFALRGIIIKPSDVAAAASSALDAALRRRGR